MKISLVSLDPKWEDKQANRVLSEQFVAVLAKENVDIIIFPEMTLSGFSMNVDLIAEDTSHPETLMFFQGLTKKYEVAIIFGVVAAKKDKNYNRSFFVDETGVVLGSYSKIHPFSFSGENKFYTAGSELTVVNYKDYSIGLTICYDLRFPELYTALAKNCDVIVNIANWPKKRIKHWNTLLKARAIENQIIIIGVNRIGLDGNNLEYVESSHIYNADGEELSYSTVHGVKVTKIDKYHTESYRNSFKTISDRNVLLYKEII